MIDDEFAAVVKRGWAPKSIASENELAGLQYSRIRGDCVSPLLIEGDEVWIDPNTPAAPGDLVSFRLSQRFVDEQNANLPSGQSPCKRGDHWVKLYTIMHGFDMLLERHGNAAMATRLSCDEPDETPILHPVRQVRRAGQLLFAPDVHATQINNNAATSVFTTTNSSFALTASIGAAACSIIVGPYSLDTTVVATASGQWVYVVGSSADNIEVFEVVSDIAPTTSQVYKTLWAGNTSSPAGTSQGGSFADENTFSLAAGSTITVYVNAYYTRGVSSSTGTLTDVTLKLEVIKR